MTWIAPLVLVVVLAGSIAVGRRQPNDRLRERIAKDPETGRSMVRSGRGAVGRVLFVFFIGGFAVGGVRLLVAGEPVGLLWLVVVGLAVASRRESRRMTARVAELLDEPVPVTEQDRIRDRFSTVYALIALVSLAGAQLLTGDSEKADEPWRLVVGFALLGITVIAGTAAMWSQAWVFSEDRWGRRAPTPGAGTR